MIIIYMGIGRDKKTGGISGGIGFRMLICAVSLVVVGGAIFTLLKTFELRKADDHRVAEKLMDYGLQKAFGKLAESPDWNTGFSEKPFEEVDGTFTVEFGREEKGDSLIVTIVSTGVSGSISRSTEHTLRLHRPAEGVEASPDTAGGPAVNGDTR